MRDKNIVRDKQTDQLAKQNSLSAPLVSLRAMAHQDFKEALGFAVLGYLTLTNRPGNAPSVTGAGRPAVLGKVCVGARGLPRWAAAELCRGGGGG